MAHPARIPPPRPFALAVTLLLVAPLASAAPPKTPARKPPAEVPAAEAEKPKPARMDPGLATLLTALRAALDASRKAGEDPDQAMLLLAGLVETSLVSVIHGHYALAGIGQAMRTGGMPPSEVQVVARDMERNFKTLAESYGRFAGQKALPVQIVDIFRSLQIVCSRAELTAGALAGWADASAEAARARAFEAALDDYRGRVRALMAGLPGR